MSSAGAIGFTPHAGAKSTLSSKGGALGHSCFSSLRVSAIRSLHCVASALASTTAVLDDIDS